MKALYESILSSVGAGRAAFQNGIYKVGGNFGYNFFIFCCNTYIL